MKDIISSIFYRLSKSVLFWVMLGVCALMPVLSYILTDSLESALLFGVMTISEESFATGTYEINALSMIADVVTPYSDYSLLAVITIAIILSREFTYGTMRNAVLANKSRAQLFFAYFLVAFIIALCYNFVAYISLTIVFGLAYSFYSLSTIKIVSAFIVIFVMMLLTCAFVSSVVMLYLFGLRKQGSTIALSIVTISVVPSIVLGIIEGVAYALSMYGIDISDTICWLPFGQYSLLDITDIDGKLVGIACLYDIVLSALCCGGGYLAFRKANLK